MELFKKSIVIGIISGVLSGVACLIFTKVYQEALYLDFSKIVTTGNLFGASIFACTLASIGFWGLKTLLPKFGEIIFNFLFSILSFASIIGPIGFKLPLDFEFPEMFPGYAIPMHFFPALIWFTLRPLIKFTDPKLISFIK